MTPLSTQHSEQFMTAMLFMPPNMNLTKEINRIIIDPYLIEAKQILIEREFTVIKKSGKSLVLAIDVGHNSITNLQCATLACASGNILLCTLTDTVNSAWLKGALLLRKTTELWKN